MAGVYLLLVAKWYYNAEEPRKVGLASKQSI